MATLLVCVVCCGPREGMKTVRVRGGGGAGLGAGWVGPNVCVCMCVRVCGFGGVCGDDDGGPLWVISCGGLSEGGALGTTFGFACRSPLLLMFGRERPRSLKKLISQEHTNTNGITRKKPKLFRLFRFILFLSTSLWQIWGDETERRDDDGYRLHDPPPFLSSFLQPLWRNVA